MSIDERKVWSVDELEVWKIYRWSEGMKSRWTRQEILSRWNEGL